MVVFARSRPGTRRRRGVSAAAVQEPLFEIQLRPERRYYRQILQALTGALLGADPLRAEIAVSRLLGVVWASDPSRDGAAEEAFGRGLVDYARQIHQPGAFALLRVLAAVGTLREVRDAAHEALAAQSALIPDCDPCVGAVTVGRCWLTEDAFGDAATLLCEFGYGPSLRVGPRHGIAIQVDEAMFSAAIDLTLVDDVDAAVHDLRYGAEHANDEFRLVEPGWAGAVLERAFARTDLIPSTVVGSGFAETRALALARVRALPSSPFALASEQEATPERREAVIGEFSRSTEASGTGAPERVARLIVDFTAVRDPGDLIKVSPARWEAFLFDWLPASGLDATHHADLADVVRAWSAWASRQSGLPLLARDELARTVDDLLQDFTAAR